MNKYLKLFETEDAFKSCLEAKIGGDNTEMGFPNVSVIGEEDSNGNFSVSDVFYIKDLNKAQAVHEYLRLNGSRWINPTTIEVTSDGANVKTLWVSIYNGLGSNGYPEAWTVVRFQPYDWYDKKTKTTYYAFISGSAYRNITESTGVKNVLEGEDLTLDLLSGINGYDPIPRFSDYASNDGFPYHGKIIYVKDLSSDPDEIYERAFTVTMDNDTHEPTLTFGTIEPFDSDGYNVSAHFSNNSYTNIIDGYYNSDSGSGSGSGSGNN